MPENEKPPATRVDFYFFFLKIGFVLEENQAPEIISKNARIYFAFGTSRKMIREIAVAKKGVAAE